MRIFDLSSNSALSAVAHAALHPSGWSRIPVQARDRFLPALAYPSFSRLWRANFGSMSAFSVQSVAQGWLVISLTDSPLMLGVLGFFQAIPMLLLSPIGGYLADRFNRARLIQLSQVAVLVGALIIAVLVGFDWIRIWHLIIFSVIVGAGFAMSVPSRHALIADLVPRNIVPNAVALNNATLSTANLTGPAIGGFLVATFGIASAYFVQVGAYAWSVVHMGFVRTAPDENRLSGSALRVVREGFEYVLREKAILGLMLLALSPSLFGWPLVTLLPAFVKHDLAAGPQELGLLLGATGAGSLVGAVVSILSTGIRNKGRVVLTTLLIYSVVLIMLSFTRSLIMAGAVLALVGFFQAVYFAFNHSIIQLVVPSEIRGRVMSIWMISWGLTPLGLLPIAAVAEAFGTPVAMALGGSLSMILVVTTMIWRRELWRLSPDDSADAGATLTR